MGKPKFFATPARFRQWLERNHDKADELVVGFYKKETGRPSITWPESVDEALCFGWIDGVRHSIDEHSYSIRFTPRKPSSNWSRVNIARAQALIETGRMQPAGLTAFERRDAKRDARYSFEQSSATFTPAQLRLFKANRAAWQHFEAQPPGYRKIATWYVISAKKEETQLRRLQRLIDDSAAGRRIAELQRPDRK